MLKEIETTDDIKTLVDEFYKKVIVDPLLGYFFNTVVKLNWDVHIPVMYKFWESVLLDKGTYKGNPMIKHIELDRKAPIQKEHFTQWIRLWEETIDEYFSGAVAIEAKRRAQLMEYLMMTKIENSRERNFIQ